MPETKSRPKKRPKKTSAANTYNIATQMANFALEKKAEDIVLLDLKGLTDMADFFIIATGSSDQHVKAIVDNIRDGFKIVGKPWHIEGLSNLKWVLLDYVDIVVHVFDKETREFYDIERLWADAKVTVVSDE